MFLSTMVRQQLMVLTWELKLGSNDSRIPGSLTVDSTVGKSVPVYDNATTDEFF